MSTDLIVYGLDDAVLADATTTPSEAIVSPMATGLNCQLHGWSLRRGWVAGSHVEASAPHGTRYGLHSKGALTQWLTGAGSP